MMKYLLFLTTILFLAGCLPQSQPPPGTRRQPPPELQAPTAEPTAAASVPGDIQAIYDEYMARHARNEAAQGFVSSLKPPLTAVHLGKGIWELTGQGRWLIKEVGRSVQPLDDEARQVLAELQVLGPNPTPRPSPPPKAAATPAPKSPPAVAAGPVPTPTAAPAPTRAPQPVPVSPKAPAATPASSTLPPNWPIYTNSIWRFSMSYPPGWTVDESLPGRVEMKSPNSEARIVFTYGWRSKQLDEWIGESLDAIPRGLWDYEFLFKEKFSRGQWEGLLIAYRGRTSFRPGSEFRDLLVSDGVIQVWISASTHGSTAVEIPALEIAVRSFQLSPGAISTPVPWWQVP